MRKFIIGVVSVNTLFFSSLSFTMDSPSSAGSWSVVSPAPSVRSISSSASNYWDHFPQWHEVSSAQSDRSTVVSSTPSVRSLSSGGSNYLDNFSRLSQISPVQSDRSSNFNLVSSPESSHYSFISSATSGSFDFSTPISTVSTPSQPDPFLSIDFDKILTFKRLPKPLISSEASSSDAPVYSQLAPYDSDNETFTFTFTSRLPASMLEPVGVELASDDESSSSSVYSSDTSTTLSDSRSSLSGYSSDTSSTLSDASSSISGKSALPFSLIESSSSTESTQVSDSATTATTQISNHTTPTEIASHSDSNVHVTDASTQTDNVKSKDASIRTDKVSFAAAQAGAPLETAVLNGSKRSGMAGRLALGYDFNRYFAMESGFMLLPKVDAKYQSPSASTVVNTKSYALDLMAIGKLPLGESFYAYGGFGGAYVYQNSKKTTVSNINGHSKIASSRSSRHGVSPKAAVGLGYKINQRTTATVEYSKIFKSGGGSTPKFDAIMVGLHYSF